MKSTQKYSENFNIIAKNFWKKIYLQYGVNIDEWFHDEDTTVSDEYETCMDDYDALNANANDPLMWCAWLVDNNYISGANFDSIEIGDGSIFKFTEKFVEDIYNESISDN